MRPSRDLKPIVQTAVKGTLPNRVEGSRGSKLVHRGEQPVSVVLNLDAYGVEVWLPDLFTDLQVIIAVVDEGLHVLGQMELTQPLQNEVWTLAHL
ncbi:hypothetical protein EYF80_011502 [Liparis tanakae]|uniref:Uncharacterized protein n=1 Tax=Liparis tanakae TaxID=230148 RepID=A0A4Z2IM37_9TELE|nr:hypothetical protein EYF80_011502 [Liparis tanakae]